MDFIMPFLPDRTKRPRQYGITMFMDKGLSIVDAENLISSSGHLIDFVKLGFGTSLFTNGAEEKIKLYHEAGIHVYLGGTLFEAFIVRKQFDQYMNLLAKLKIETAEVSDGCLSIPHDDKCEYIKTLAEDFLVLSVVGSKDAEIIYDNEKWVDMIISEKNAGSWKVITEARETGNIGIYNSDGKANEELIDHIVSNISEEHIIWEAPQKSQQVWLIKKFGANVNLGNIAPVDVIALEALRNGLRGDTFHDFLPDII